MPDNNRPSRRIGIHNRSASVDFLQVVLQPYSSATTCHIRHDSHLWEHFPDNENTLGGLSVHWTDGEGGISKSCGPRGVFVLA